MKKLLIAAMLCGLFSIPLYAQDYPKFEIYGGYQMFFNPEILEKQLKDANLTAIKPERMNGFNTAFEYRLKRYLGVVGEFSHGRASDTLIYEYPGDYSEQYAYKKQQTTFLFGPRLSCRYDRFRLFGHVLLGGNHENSEYTYGFNDTTANVHFTDPHKYSATNFAIAYGGGLDISINKWLSVRPVQVDAISTFHGLKDVSGANNPQFRYSGGILFKLGSAK
jgi:opacity protein-like surface antigen